MAWLLQQLNVSGQTNGPASATNPSVVDYSGQMHVCYRDSSGHIQDVWYSGSRWNVQQLSPPTAPGAAGDPFALSYGNQMHVCYRDTGGNLQDAWYDGAHWNLQELAGGGNGAKTPGPPPAGDLSACDYTNQMHVCYRDGGGNIQDVWYNGSGSWAIQQLNGAGGKTNGPAAAGDPVTVIYGNQMHVCYTDKSGNIQDAWYDGAHWNLQQLTGGGSSKTAGLPATGNLSACDYNNQMHVCYRDRTGHIQDVWYDGAHWNLQQLTGGGTAKTSGPVSASDPDVVIYGNQMHVCYVDTSGKTQDAWYNGSGTWAIQRLPGVGAVGDTSSVGYTNQMHVCYRDSKGDLFDAWYSPSTVLPAPGSRNLNLSEQPQQESEWCWIATSVSITLFYEPRRILTQCQLASQAVGISTCCTAPQGWSPQQLNLGQTSSVGGGLTTGPAAVSNPAVIVYSNQMHVCYSDRAGNIQDAWYDSAHWNLQQLTGGGGAKTGGPAAAGNLSPVDYGNQMHVCYRDKSGNIQDVWYNGSGAWAVQALTGSGGKTNGVAAVSNPAALTYSGQMHVCYVDNPGNVQDAWYDGSHWNLQQLTGAGPAVKTGGPAAAGGVSPVEYESQMHACYTDKSGNIQDVWWNGSNWSMQQLTGTGGKTAGSSSAGNPTAVTYSGQKHVCYRDRGGNIQDAWYDGSHWNLQQLSGSGPAVKTAAPAAVGDPIVIIYDGQMHVCYVDNSGNIQDAWWDGANWNWQRLTGAGGVTGFPGIAAPAAIGLSSGVEYSNQMHVCYLSNQGEVLDTWYNGQSCNTPGDPSKALGITGHYGRVLGSVSIQDVMNEINLGHPLSLNIQWYGGGGHNPACDGYDTTNPANPTIDIQDPIYGHSVVDFNTFPGGYNGGATLYAGYTTH